MIILIIVMCFFKFSTEFALFSIKRNSIYTWMLINLCVHVARILYLLAVYTTINNGNLKFYQKIDKWYQFIVLALGIYGLVVINRPENFYVTALTENEENILQFCVILAWLRNINLFCAGFLCSCFCLLVCCGICCGNGRLGDAVA